MTDHRLIDHDAEDDYDYDEIGPHQRYTFALDEDGDLMFNKFKNTFQTVEKEDAVKQSLKVALGTAKGEDPLDEEFGLDRFKATRGYRQLEREVRRVLNYDDFDHSRVRHVENVTVQRVGRSRKAHVRADVRLDTGVIEQLELDIGVAI